MLLYVIALAATLAICVKVTPSVERSIRKFVSLLELSVHASVILVALAAVAVRPDGAAGRADCVVAEAVLE